VSTWGNQPVLCYFGVVGGNENVNLGGVEEKVSWGGGVRNGLGNPEPGQGCNAFLAGKRKRSDSAKKISYLGGWTPK